MYNILIVEDNQAVQRNIQKLVKQTGEMFCVIGKAINGVQGLEIMEQNNIDIVITDIQMAVMNGLELIEKAKSLYPCMGYMIISGYDEFEYARTAMKLRVQEYILKPVDQQEFKEALVKIASEVDVLKMKYQPILSLAELNDLLQESDLSQTERVSKECNNIAERLDLAIIKWDKQRFFKELHCMIDEWVKRKSSIEEIQSYLMVINGLIVNKKHCQNEFNFTPFVKNILFFSKTYEDLKKITEEFYRALFNKIENLAQEKKYSGEELFEKMILYLKEHIYSMVNMQDMKEYFQVSPSYMNRIFKQYSQVSPMVYYNNLKIEEAKKIMYHNPDTKIGEIADILGFNDQYYFSKVFKTAEGISPQEFKRMNEQ